MQKKVKLPFNLFVLGIILFVMGVIWPNYACNVPVFRYALERWRPDIYQIVIYYQDSIDQKALALLQHEAARPNSSGNFSLKLIDTSTPAGQLAANQNEIQHFPWFEIYYPQNSQVRGFVWGGPFNLVNVQKILHSPARTFVVNNLLKGDAAVWVLLMCGDRQKDEKAFQLLNKNLERASQELKIPATRVDIDGNPIDVTDFKDYPVHFSLIQIAHHDSDEVLLINMLSGSEPDLQDYHEPLAFPIFGRGRALYALIGSGIHERTIRQACRSVINWCSCEVKASNPGIDLLISADWSKPAGGMLVKSPPLPPLTGFSQFISDSMPTHEKKTLSAANAIESTMIKTELADSQLMDSIEVMNRSTRAALPQETNNIVMRNMIFIIVSSIFLVVGLTIFLLFKKRRVN